MSSLELVVKYNKADLSRLQPHLANWVKTHAYIRQMETTEVNMLELRKMMSVEIDTRGNVQIVTRLRSRFIAMRKQLEDQLLFSKLAAEG